VPVGDAGADAGGDAGAKDAGGTGNDAGAIDAGGPGGTRIVLFGGLGGGDTPLYDTWLNVASGWISSTASGPPERYNSAMARQGTTIAMFGGFDNTQSSAPYLFDTWVFDGTTWTSPTTVSIAPGQRAGHAMATLPNGNAILFGGFNGNVPFNDTWVFDGATWTETNTGTTGSVPQARYDCAMAQAGGKVVLFGGTTSTSSGGATGDTWTTTDGVTWTQVTSTPAPSARYALAMATLGTSTAVLFGGSTGSDTPTDTWTFDGSNWTPSPATGPGGRIDTAMATQGNTVVLFAGGAGNDDTWVFDGGTWTETNTGTSGPSGRDSHSMATLP
jgi:hypothetical protein